MVISGSRCAHPAARAKAAWAAKLREKGLRQVDDGREHGRQMRTHLANFLAAHNFARRLNTLNGLTPYEYICKIWTSGPDRFIVNPICRIP